MRRRGCQKDMSCSVWRAGHDGRGQRPFPSILDVEESVSFGYSHSGPDDLGITTSSWYSRTVSDDARICTNSDDSLLQFEVVVEYCTRETFHTQHSVEKYESYFLAVQEAFRGRHPTIDVIGNPESMTHRGRCHRPLTMADHMAPLEDVSRPRLGAFEVTMRSRHHGDVALWSKLQMGRWPNPRGLVAKAEQVFMQPRRRPDQLPPLSKQAAQIARRMEHDEDVRCYSARPGRALLKVKRNAPLKQPRAERAWANPPPPPRPPERVKDVREFSRRLYSLIESTQGSGYISSFPSIDVGLPLEGIKEGCILAQDPQKEQAVRIARLASELTACCSGSPWEDAMLRLADAMDDDIKWQDMVPDFQALAKLQTSSVGGASNQDLSAWTSLSSPGDVFPKSASAPPAQSRPQGLCSSSDGSCDNEPGATALEAGSGSEVPAAAASAAAPAAAAPTAPASPGRRLSPGSSFDGQPRFDAAYDEFEEDDGGAAGEAAELAPAAAAPSEVDQPEAAMRELYSEFSHGSCSAEGDEAPSPAPCGPPRGAVGLRGDGEAGSPSPPSLQLGYQPLVEEATPRRTIDGDLQGPD